MKPRYVVIIGAQKSGTTALHRFLAEHPSLAMSDPKETNFFVRQAPPADYLLHFSDWQNKRWLVEASPIYMLRCEQVAPRIASYAPDARLIVLLRDPIARAYSQFHMLLQIGKATGDFPTALAEARRIQSVEKLAFDPVSGYPVRPVQTLLLYGHYCEQLQCFWRHFSDDQVLILRHEDLRYHHRQTLERVFAFLDLEPLSIQPQAVHQREYPPLTLQAWNELHACLGEEIETLERLLGWDLSAWKQPPAAES